MEPSRINTLFSSINTRKKYALSVLMFVLFTLLIVFSVYETTKATVTVLIDGEEHVVQTHANTVGKLISEQGWEMNEYDEVTPALNTEISGNLVVDWQVAREIKLTVNNEPQTIWTTVKDVEALLNSLEIKVDKEDLVTPELNATIEAGMNVIYEPAFIVRLNSDGDQLELKTTSTTVADFLERESINLAELDRVEPGMDTLISKEIDINVIRVEKVTDVVEESVAFATETRRDNSLNQGKEQVVQSGEQGLVNKYYEVILENGKEVSRAFVKKDIVKEGKDHIVAVGTKQIAPQVSRGGSPGSVQSTSGSKSVSTSSSTSSSSTSASSGSSASSSSGKTMTVTATAYTANCAGCSGITATGINLNNNRNAKVIAVDPNVIPLGSRVHVEGYGTAIAGDTGGAIRGKKIDIHVPTKSDANNWGRKQVKITILD